MKCIYPDRITAISADEEDASYPVSNLQDEHPKKVWKGTSRDAVITAVASAGGALALIATNATSVSLAISSGQTINWASGVTWQSDVSWDSSGDDDVSEVALLPGDSSGCAWFDFAARTSSFSVTLTLTAQAGEIIQAGVLRIGTCNSFDDPAYGLKEGLQDYSIVKELNNGATYIRKRDVVRTFQGRITEDRDTDFYTFLLDVAKKVGPTPLAWRLVHNITDSEWIVFARFRVMPIGSHDRPLHSRINFDLLEVL